MTHYAMVVSSRRIIRVRRYGRLLYVFGGRTGVLGMPFSTCRYDKRFVLFPRGYVPDEEPV